MKIVLHGIFARDYGAGVEIFADSVFEALEAFSRQVGFYADRLLVDRPRARVVGFDSEEALRAPAAQDTIIHLVPAMFGGGGKFGRIIAGIVMVGVGLLIPGLGAAAWIGKLSTALIAAGAMTTLNGVLGLFIQAPRISKITDPDASLYLGAADMTTAIGTPIPICLGTVKHAGHALSLDVTANSLTYGTFPETPT